MNQVNRREKQVRVPVRCLGNSTFEYFFGGALPKIASGTIGELVIPEAALEGVDSKRLKSAHTVEFLPADAAILFVVDGASASPAPAGCLKDASELKVPGKPYAVEVRLQDPAVLRLRGTRSAALEEASCWIPCLRRETRSLDRAYRVVCETFDAHRVFSRRDVFQFGFHRLQGRWLQLDELRLEREARYDMRLSPMASEVLRTLPSKVAGLLQLCWTGQLVSPESLEDLLDQYRQRMRRFHQESDLVDIDVVEGLVGTCQVMVRSIAGRGSNEHHRLAQAAVKYLVREDDEESDTESLSGFADDARVVHAAAAALQGATRTEP